ncbi:hypothetical protein [Vibrio sp.]|uniref:hypothetical protein n=1 Tax=Vibrio sp. TaxID=678 RepID=UPI003D0AE94F
MKKEAVLTPAEIEICKRSLDNPNLFTDYFFRPFGESKGWRFDENFDEKGAWQRDLHSASQKDITVIGGFGTGKTIGVAMSACTWATLTADFKFLNIGPKAWQAQQMYDMILLNARNTRFEDLIWEKPRRPHPKITLRFKIGAILYESTLEFMSADKDATGILSWEGDWLHIDEAGLLDNLEEIIINVGSRLRGTVRGRERLGRFSMTSNSWDNFYLWYYFDQAASDPENFLSIVVSSRHNHNVTKDQLKRMLARIPEDERERFIDGTRPEGRGSFFDKQSVYACEIPHAIEIAQKNQLDENSHFKVEKLHGAGVTYYMTPPLDKRIYMVFGDPGTGAAPTRNAPVLMTWDVTDFPTLPAKLVAFYWGNGGGKIGPFISELLKLASLYRPVYAGIDSTGPQKNMNYLINEYALKNHFEGKQMPAGIINGIAGMDFSGPKKISYLHALRLLIEGRLITWPKNIVGIRSQLTNYDFENDKKIAQDVVATMAMSAHAIRWWFHVSPEDIYEQMHREASEASNETRRLSPSERSRRSSRARSPKFQ